MKKLERLAEARTPDGTLLVLFRHDGEYLIRADGAELTTVEGLAPGPEQLHAVQEAFRSEHGLQCGFCTPWMMMVSVALLEKTPAPSEQQIREAISGNLCRCTGYVNIVHSVQHASKALRASAEGKA